MRKPSIYLDTSLISHLNAVDTPERMNDTLILWNDIKNGDYNIIISSIVLEEISECPEPKQSILLQYLAQIDYVLQSETTESLELVDKYLKYDVLKAKSRDDLRHIALAVVLESDYIVSWNFKHFVNIRVINKVQVVNRLLGYREISILPPSMLLGGDDNDEWSTIYHWRYSQNPVRKL